MNVALKAPVTQDGGDMGAVQRQINALADAGLVTRIHKGKQKMDIPEKQKERDPDLINAEVALKRAAQKARQRAGQEGIGVVVMQDGKIVEERSDRSLPEAPFYEK